MRWLVLPLLVACAPSARAQTLDSVHHTPVSRTVTLTGTVTVDSAASYYLRVDTLIPPAVHDTIWVPPSTALRSLPRYLPVGASVKRIPFDADSTYRNALATYYSAVVGEDANSLKFGPVHPGASTYNWVLAEALYSFAAAHGQQMHGNAIVWDQSVPTWVTTANYTKPQLMAVLKDHITTLLTHFAGRVPVYALVNEAVDWNGTLRPMLWLNVIGPEYIDSSFVWAHRADPAAKLYLNDYNIENNATKGDSLLALAVRLKAKGVPIDGIGYQMHLFPAPSPAVTATSMRLAMAKAAAAGFTVYVSELDKMIPDTASAATKAAQAVWYRDVMDACLASGRCAGVTSWGLSDKYSWVPAAWPGYGRALPFDSAYHPKAAYDSLVARLGRVP